MIAHAPKLAQGANDARNRGQYFSRLVKRANRLKEERLVIEAR
jgi:hypothetical protein